MNFDLPGLFLAQVTSYGALALGLMMLLRGLGLPLPTGLVVIAFGALARSGQME